MPQDAGARRGRLIVLEGAEGVGKSTQLRLLADRLTASGQPVLAVREPGGTPLGDEIRRVLLDPASDIVPAAEALLFMASRAQLVARQVVPALEEGRVVLVDRFFLSTYAYQVAGRGLDAGGVRAANALATGGLVPDLTLLLALPVAQGLARAAARGVADRMEGAARDFHDRVSSAFMHFSSADWQRENPEAGEVVPVDASGDPHEVSGRIGMLLHGRWPETFPRWPA